jgi:hypothetical protein
VTTLEEAITAWVYPFTGEPWTYEVEHRDVPFGADAGTLRIIVQTINTYPPHDPVVITHQYVIPPWVTYGREEALAFLRQCTVKTVVHEMDENIRVDGVMVFDPHRDDHPGDVT